jgi:hypothetical protein
MASSPVIVELPLRSGGEADALYNNYVPPLNFPGHGSSLDRPQAIKRANLNSPESKSRHLPSPSFQAEDHTVLFVALIRRV